MTERQVDVGPDGERRVSEWDGNILEEEEVVVCVLVAGRDVSYLRSLYFGAGHDGVIVVYNNLFGFAYRLRRRFLSNITRFASLSIED